MPGRGHLLFREVNDRIFEAALSFGLREIEFICECLDTTCAHRVQLTSEEYRAVRAHRDTYVVCAGHEDADVDQVVSSHDGHLVVRAEVVDDVGRATA